MRVHPGYNAQTLANDLALLELARPVSGVAQLDDGAAETAGASATAIGWGSTTATPAGDYPDALRQTVIDVEPDSACSAGLRRRLRRRDMLCAGIPKGGRDTCQGDSGGPLVGAGPAGAVVIGFTSFGGACGQAGAPGAYVRATVAASWLATGGTTSPDRTVTLAQRKAAAGGIRPVAKPKQRSARQP